MLEFFVHLSVLVSVGAPVIIIIIIMFNDDVGHTGPR